MYILKGLYLEYKVKAYDKAIIGATKTREKLKAKQAKMTESYEKYVKALKDHRG